MREGLREAVYNRVGSIEISLCERKGHGEQFVNEMLNMGSIMFERREA